MLKSNPHIVYAGVRIGRIQDVCRQDQRYRRRKAVYKMAEKPFFPIYLDVSQKKLVLIGPMPRTGRAAQQIAGYCEEVIVIVPPKEKDGRTDASAAAPLPSNVKFFCKQYDRDDLYSADMVFCFSEDDEINRDVYAACKCLGIAVYIDSNKYKRDFYLRPKGVQTDGRTENKNAAAFQQQAGSAANTDKKNTPAGENQVRRENGQRTAALLNVRMYTDGSARGNPDGPGGYGTILEFTDSDGNLHRREYSRGYRKTTNNRMELMAAIAGFRQLKVPCKVEVYSDSKYLIDAFNRHWIDNWKKNNWQHTVNGRKEPVRNQDLWNQLLEALNGHTVSFRWVKGHNGHPQNERCDELAVSAACSEELRDEDTAV